MDADGGHDIHTNLDLSGEPIIPILKHSYGIKKEPEPLLEYQKNTVLGLEYEAGYSDYWNSTAADDGELRRYQRDNQGRRD